ncbi:MAG TPA: peptidylprolyl isomerase [Chloroflexota bacterium]|jgi:cyclophilin family peptidyl-prolyl cis-trans isomerase|nr:peptidylprolyl isomerase [Chloroflexota bacterium]
MDVTHRRTVIATVPALLVAAACAQASGKEAAPKEKSAVVELEKGGSFTIKLAPEVAPKAVQNFEEKASKGFYNGLSFHRVEDWVVQGGDPRGNGTGGNMTLPTEASDRPFVVGSLGMARLGTTPQVSNDAQFFICTKPAEWLNGQYTNFGSVTQGIEVVQGIKVGDKIKRISVKA